MCVCVCVCYGVPGTPALDGLKAVPFEWFAARNHEPDWPLGGFVVPGRSIVETVEAKKGIVVEKLMDPNVLFARKGAGQRLWFPAMKMTRPLGEGGGVGCYIYADPGM